MWLLTCGIAVSKDWYYVFVTRKYPKDISRSYCCGSAPKRQIGSGLGELGGTPFEFPRILPPPPPGSARDTTLVSQFIGIVLPLSCYCKFKSSHRAYDRDTRSVNTATNTVTYGSDEIAGAEFPRAYARIHKPVSTGIENDLELIAPHVEVFCTVRSFIFLL